MRLNQPPEVFAYWAGVFDSAGTMYMRKVHGLWSPRIGLNSRNPQYLNRLVAIYDGRAAQYEDYYKWERSHAGAVIVVRSLLPYLIVRVEIAQEIADWVVRKRGPKKNIIRSRPKMIKLMNELET